VRVAIHHIQVIFLQGGKRLARNLDAVLGDGFPRAAIPAVFRSCLYFSMALGLNVHNPDFGKKKTPEVDKPTYLDRFRSTGMVQPMWRRKEKTFP